MSLLMSGIRQLAAAGSLPGAKEEQCHWPIRRYPLLNVFWSIFIFFLWVIWIWILISIFIDIFRSHDLSGWAKALWFLFVLFIPLIGVLVYLIARGGKMHERAVQQAQQQDQEFRHYVQQAAASAPASGRTSCRSWPTCATGE